MSLSLVAMLAGCGGGSSASGSGDAAAASDADPLATTAMAANADPGPAATAQARRAGRSTGPTRATAPMLDASDSQRIAAAAATAESTTNDCAPVRPFYWEVGDRNAKIGSGSVVGPNGPKIASTTPMGIASASKWIFAAYVAERRHGALDAGDVEFLNFRSGYTSFSLCEQGQTVDGCLAYATNGAYTAANEGKFLYNGGHMEKHASLLGLGSLNNQSLAAEIRSQIGADVVLTYTQPQLAGGVLTTAGDYARFLRKLLDGQLAMGGLLGAYAVCTNPATCAQARFAPTPAGESWHYSLGHWVEDDPQVGDGAFSSGGAFGFYPWIDAHKSYYGIVARMVQDGGKGSVYCGRAIRKAWLTGVAQ
jgi:hypothetical protein